MCRRRRVVATTHLRGVFVVKSRERTTFFVSGCGVRGGGEREDAKRRTSSTEESADDNRRRRDECERISRGHV